MSLTLGASLQTHGDLERRHLPAAPVRLSIQIESLRDGRFVSFPPGGHAGYKFYRIRPSQPSNQNRQKFLS